MIKKKEWEKSFKNINGRLPKAEEYEKAVSEGIVQEESSDEVSNKKTIIIIGSVIGGLLVIAIAILLLMLFYPKPSNQQSSFNNTSTTETSSSTNSSSTTKDSSTKIDLTKWTNLTLNEKIALLVQAYAAVNPQTTVLTADNIAMTANGSNGVNDGYIQWYDEARNPHKLNVVITGNTISFSYLDATTGETNQKATKVSSVLSSYYHSAEAKQTTEDIASKVVTPAELENSVSHMDLESIASGNYSSITGTWKNLNGEVLNITDTSIEGSGLQNDSYVINALKITVKNPELNGVNGLKSTNLKATVVNGILSLKADSPKDAQGYPQFASVGIIFYPKDKSTDNSGDATKDRIFFGYNSNVVDNYIFYKQ